MTRVAAPLPSPAAASDAILAAWAAEPGRSVRARLACDDGRAWEGGHAADVPRPGASVLKVAIGIAADRAIADGTLDPDGPVPVAELRARTGGPGLPWLLGTERALSVSEAIGLMLALSENAATAAILDRVGLPAVRAALVAAGCPATTIGPDPGDPAAPPVGTTTATDALALLAAGTDAARHPRTAHALANSLLNSRIPLGATGHDVAIAHKTGSLPGVAHDVALLTADGGTLAIAFLTEAQHDTLTAGYAMGIATRTLLETWGLGVRRTRGLG
ncbi:MAG: serine hydrolase [Chloroflexota bacterium]